jgi:putative transposase
MSHTYTYLATHIVFSTKDRAPLITSDLKSRLYAYVSGILRDLNSKPTAMNGTADHVHLLVWLPPTLALAEAMRVVKANSSKWVNEELRRMEQRQGAKFGWQTGYAAFSVSRSGVDEVVRYIEQQEEHHRKFSFQEEFLALLKKHDIDFDERYIWN